MNTIQTTKQDHLNSKLIAYCESCSAKNPASFRGAKDALTGEEYEDLCCDSCHSILATLSGRLPAGEAEPVAEVVWYDPEPIGLSVRRSGKIIDASMAFFDNATVGTKLYTTPQQSQPLTDEQYLELLLRTGSKELLHYTAFVNDTLQGRGQMQLLKSAKDIRDFVEAAHGIKKGATE